MKTCQHCGGDLLRHSVHRHYRQDPSIIGIRYKCRECSKTFTVRIPKQSNRHDPIQFHQTGRPHQCDWRMKDITPA